MYKYRSKKTKIDGIVFASKKEAIRYEQLKLLQRAKEIKNLSTQTKFQLQKSFKYNGSVVKEINYVADFVYFSEKDQIWVVEDVKGFETPVFKLKWKMMKKLYPQYLLLKT